MRQHTIYILRGTPGRGIKKGPRSLRRGTHTYPHIPLRPSRKNSVRVTILLKIVRNPHIILARGSESVFQWGKQVCVRSSTETAGSLRITGDLRPGVPIYVYNIHFDV